jgi:hypothetical protein
MSFLIPLFKSTHGLPMSSLLKNTESWRHVVWLSKRRVKHDMIFFGVFGCYTYLSKQLNCAYKYALAFFLLFIFIPIFPESSKKKRETTADVSLYFPRRSVQRRMLSRCPRPQTRISPCDDFRGVNFSIQNFNIVRSIFSDAAKHENRRTV